MRMHPAHAALHRAAGLRQAGSAPGELPALGQLFPAATAGPGLAAQPTAAAAAAAGEPDRPYTDRQRGETAAAGRRWDSGQSAASAPAAMMLSRAGSSRGSSPLISPTNNPGDCSTHLPSSTAQLPISVCCLGDTNRPTEK